MAEHSYSRFLRQIESFENSPQKTEFELRSDRLNQNEITRQRICNNYKVFFQISGDEKVFYTLEKLHRTPKS